MKLRLALFATLLAALAGCGSTTTKTVVRRSSTAPPGTTTTPTTTGTAAATTTTLTTAPVYFQGVVGPPAQRPGALELTADGTLSVERVQWSSWGGSAATGTGNAIYHGCTPNCAAARVHAAIVSVRLSDVRTCHGRRYYSGLELTLSSGQLLDRQFVQRSWSPC
jgi:hypothetical protein